MDPTDNKPDEERLTLEDVAAYRELHGDDEEPAVNLNLPLSEWPRPSYTEIVRRMAFGNITPSPFPWLTQGAVCAGLPTAAEEAERKAQRREDMVTYLQNEAANRQEGLQRLAAAMQEHLPPPVLRVIYLPASPDGPHVFDTQPGDDR